MIFIHGVSSRCLRQHFAGAYILTKKAFFLEGREYRPVMCVRFAHCDATSHHWWLYLAGGLICLLTALQGCGYRFEPVPRFNKILKKQVRRPGAPDNPDSL